MARITICALLALVAVGCDDYHYEKCDIHRVEVRVEAKWVVHVIDGIRYIHQNPAHYVSRRVCDEPVKETR